MEDNKLISVRNRNCGETGYVIPDRNINRSWQPNEIKKIPFEELRAFSYMPGGLYCLNNLLVVEDQTALDALNMDVEPEYFYTEADIKRILLQGTIDEFADFLDFAPEGAIGLAKEIAVKEEIPDVRKRDMLYEKTGLNINNAIMVNKVMAEEEDAEKDAPKQRRVQKKEEPAAAPKEEAPKRRTTPNYKVVKKG